MTSIQLYDGFSVGQLTYQPIQWTLPNRSADQSIIHMGGPSHV